MLNRIKYQYDTYKLTPKEFLYELHKQNLKLYEYSELIKNSDCKKISIEQDDVYFHFQSEGIDIQMTCLPFDKTSVPFTHLAFNGYDKKETSFIMNMVKDGDTILDIGANLGWYSIHWLSKLKNATVSAFEPVSETYEKLVKNLSINNCVFPEETTNRSLVYNFGLSNINGEVDFFFDQDRCGASSMRKIQDHENYKTQKVRVRRLDDCIDKMKLDKVDFVKIDVEGAEKLVIEGAIETISKYKPKIYCELLRKWSAKFDYNPNEVIDILSKLGYKCYIIDENLKTKEIFCITEDTEETNFLFLQ